MFSSIMSYLHLANFHYYIHTVFLLIEYIIGFYLQICRDSKNIFVFKKKEIIKYHKK